MAARVLDALAIPHQLATASADLPESSAPVVDMRANLRWAAAFAPPWVVRRVRRMTPGEGVEPKSWTLTEVT